MKKLIKIISGMCAFLAISLPAQAHYIWLEPVDGQARLYFGEYGEGVREKTVGVWTRLPCRKRRPTPRIASGLRWRCSARRITSRCKGLALSH